MGRFYSETGEPTDTLLNVEKLLVEGRRLKAQSEAEKVRFPPCNSEWSAGRGGRVWCSPKRYGHSSGRTTKHDTLEKLRLNSLDYVCFLAAVEWPETGPASHGGSSLQLPAESNACALKTQPWQRTTPTCRNTTAALLRRTHALWENTNLWTSPELNGTKPLTNLNKKSNKTTRTSTQNLFQTSENQETTHSFFHELYVKLSSCFLKHTRKRRPRDLSIQEQYSVQKRLNNVHKRSTEARFRFVTTTSTNCI